MSNNTESARLGGKTFGNYDENFRDIFVPLPGDLTRFYPTKFLPSRATDTPKSLFDHSEVPAAEFSYNRFIHVSGRPEILIYTDGACLNNGQANAAAGCAFVFRPEADRGTVQFRLENRGPNKHLQPQTSNRAELRAVVAALGFRVWGGEHWKKLMIATDSEYVTNGATDWAKSWEQNGWKTVSGELVKNQDLWKLLLKAVRYQASKGCEVLFWAIPRKLNGEADAAAKKAALGKEQDDFQEIYGNLV